MNQLKDEKKGREITPLLIRQVGSMGGLLGPTLVPGNRVETLLNGDEIFPAMLKAIRAAEKTITFENYIYWSGISVRSSGRRCR